MSALAHIVMRSRMWALLIVMMGAGSIYLCWISAAALALVTLRRGIAHGAWLLFWALLPAGALLYVFGNASALALLLGTTALACLLRVTVSLPLTLLGSVVVAAVFGVLMMMFGGAYLDQLSVFFATVLEGVEQRFSTPETPLTLHRPVPWQIAGMLGALVAIGATLCLLLGRYWQAELYNPRGFGEEFRALRYPAPMTLGLVLPALMLASAGIEYRSWAMIFFIPLTFAGFSLVHARAKLRGGGSGWLAVFYLSWMLFDPVKLVVVFFAVADSWFDFRQRWLPGGAGNSPSANRRRDDE